MSVLVKQVEDKLCELVKDAAEKAMAAGTLPEAELTDFNVEVPADRRNGDYSTNASGKRVRTAVDTSFLTPSCSDRSRMAC